MCQFGSYGGSRCCGTKRARFIRKEAKRPRNDTKMHERELARNRIGAPAVARWQRISAGLFTKSMTVWRNGTQFVVGVAAEHSTAALVAMRNKMDLAFRADWCRKGGLTTVAGSR